MTDLFDTASGRAVVIAMDHGLALGAPDGFVDPQETLDAVIDGGPDGLLVGPHFARRFSDTLRDADVDLVLTADIVTFSTVPGEQAGEDLWTEAFSPELLERLDPAAVKVVLVFGREDRDIFLRNIRTVARLAEELDVPLAVEPVMWGSRVPDGDKTDPALVAHACRQAWEYGADILKAPYTGDHDSFARIVETAPVPVMVLGGASHGTAQDLLEEVSTCMDAGARGTMIGRRAWQRDDPAAVVDALTRVVHEDADPATVAESL